MVLPQPTTPLSGNTGDIFNHTTIPYHCKELPMSDMRYIDISQNGIILICILIRHVPTPFTGIFRSHQHLPPTCSLMIPITQTTSGPHIYPSIPPHDTTVPSPIGLFTLRPALARGHFRQDHREVQRPRPPGRQASHLRLYQNSNQSLTSHRNISQTSYRPKIQFNSYICNTKSCPPFIYLV